MNNHSTPYFFLSISLVLFSPFYVCSLPLFRIPLPHTSSALNKPNLSNMPAVPDETLVPQTSGQESPETTTTTTSGTETAKTLQSKEMAPSDNTNYSILWWTPPITTTSSSPSSQEEKGKGQEAGDSLPFTLDTCGIEYTCTFTADRPLLSTSNAVLFTASQLDQQDLLPAAERLSSQAWILNTVLEDPAEINAREAIISALDPTHIWSHSFQTADFVETAFQSPNPLSDQKVSFLDVVTTPPRIDLQEKNHLRGLGKENGGRASAVWITTGTETEGLSCQDAPSGRENYMRELVKVMDVDIYGPCMNNSAWPVHPDTQRPYTTQEIMAEYKFVFALERVNCQDYVTQHLADALTVGAVPIVDGPADYTRFLPSANAFVQVHSFIAPEQLAQEIDRLDRNDTLYIERMSYRRGHAGVAGNGSEVVMEGEGGGIGGEILTLFRETFGGASESTLTTPPSTATTTTRSWTPDRHGVYCGICQLAHNLAKNTYDWKARTQQRTEISNNNNNSNSSSSLSSTLGCESEPRYLPGLPAQMQAYDTFLQSENDQAVLQQQQEMETLRQKQEQQVQEEQEQGQVDTTVMDPTTVHVVNVTVSFNSHNESDSSGSNATNQSSIISQPSVVVLHQDVTSYDSSKPLQHLSKVDPAVIPDNAFDYATTTNGLDDSTTTLPLSEVYYLLLLILAMFVGVGALVLILSKSARQKLLWPWRHLFYKKLPRDDPRDAAAALSLERVMLRELGSDILYD
ncbi:MAG: glycosyltransferase family 10-domain-containing protein [Linnemannia gamsii]|nr:MAG: glycosyltransferase family 10-domain-containing protein [Linnemannia gamsii]